jgi:enoyl-[acyl-carrier protein] reductase I
MLLSGTRGLIVGISGESSIGYACLRTFRSLGAEVAVTYRPARKETCAALAERAGATLHTELEITDESSIANAIAGVESAFTRLDFLVHTVMHVPEGVLSRPLLSVKSDEFGEALSIGAYSLVALCRGADRLLRASASPRVVTLTSSGGETVMPSYHVAGIAKAALEATVRYLSAELGPAGILVNAVSASLIDTDGARRAVGEEAAKATRAHLAKKAPSRRAVEAEDVARTVAWLASPMATNLTGEVITVDGGYSRLYF